MTAIIQTVSGSIPASQLSMTLCHEHILVDFIGAQETGPHRWLRSEVFRTMLPYLKAAYDKGVRGFVDCTPAYLGRDAQLLKDLAEATGLNILTNTGYYGAAADKFLPSHTFHETHSELADRWIAEWEKGIEGTGIHPGFIKIGVDPILRKVFDPPDYGLSEVDAKLVRAAAETHQKTGLVIASHTGQGDAALSQLRILEEWGVAPSAFIVVHADAEPDSTYDQKILQKGAWLEFDAVGRHPLDYHLNRIAPLVDQFADQLLFSMDSGWFNAGEPGGGKINDYHFISDFFIPALSSAGYSDQQIHQWMVANPAKAFAVSKES